jgi:hypothetical protein
MTDYNYTANYSSSEISEVAIDNLVGIGAALFSFVSIIGIVLLWRWLRGKKTF